MIRLAWSRTSGTGRGDEPVAGHSVVAGSERQPGPDIAYALVMRSCTATGERVAKLAWNLMLSTGCASSMEENRFNHSP